MHSSTRDTKPVHVHLSSASMNFAVNSGSICPCVLSDLFSKWRCIPGLPSDYNCLGSIRFPSSGARPGDKATIFYSISIAIYYCRALESLQSYLSGRCLHLISALFSQSSLLPAHEKYTSLLDRDLDTVSGMCTIFVYLLICACVCACTFLPMDFLMEIHFLPRRISSLTLSLLMPSIKQAISMHMYMYVGAG